MTRLFLMVAISVLLPFGAFADDDVSAGDDATLECASEDGEEYTLNGIAPTDDGFSFEWSTDPEVDLQDDDTLTPTGVFPGGETVVTLTSIDPNGAEESDDAVITVEDTESPVARAAADPFVLWPPNHKMHEVEVELRARDRCSDRDDLDVKLVGASSNERDNGHGDGNTNDDIQEADFGEDDREVLLRAERSGGGDGRVYTLTYEVTDASGNATEVDAKVHVPHDASDLRRLLDKIDGDEDSVHPICPGPVAAVDLFTDAFPELSETGSKRACLRACKVWTKGCAGIVKGTSQCLRAEGRSRVLLHALECRNEDDRGDARQCRKDTKNFAKRLAEQLRHKTREAGETCKRRGERCANACEDIFDAK
jgi:hypothetical protein